MHSKLIVFVVCTCLVILTNGPQCVEAEFLDDIPIFSQIKSFFLGRHVNHKRENQAERKFLNDLGKMISMVSEKIVVEFEGREETPESFYEKMLEPILDYTPIVGHLKAEIHAEMGDKRKAGKTLDKANTLPEIIMKFAANLFKRIQHFF